MYHYVLWHHIFENFQTFQRAIESLQQLTKTTWQTTVEEKHHVGSFGLLHGLSLLHKQIIDIPAAGLSSGQKFPYVENAFGVFILDPISSLHILAAIQNDIDALPGIGPEISVCPAPQISGQSGAQQPGFFQGHFPLLMPGINGPQHMLTAVSTSLLISRY